MMSLPPGDLSKYEGIITNLRVNELQSILTHFKSPKLGKKQELVFRCIGLLKSHPHQAEIIKLIDDLSRRSYRPTPYQVPPRGNIMNSMNGMMNGYGGGSTMYGAQSSTSAQLPPARGLRPLSLPFYDPICTLLEPVQLPAAGNPGAKTPMRQTMFFHIPREQAATLYYRADSKTLPRHEIQLRFFFLGIDFQNKEQPDDFPLNCQVRVDDQSVTLPNIIPTNKPNVEPKRPSRPVNITPFCQPPRETPGRAHKLHVEWTGDRRVWACGVYVVNRVTAAILRERAAANENKQQSAEATKQIVIRRLGTGDDDGITMDQLKISLLCPLGKIRMALPARCRDCTHLQCFDLDLYLQMNEKRPTWKCAVCSGNATYDRLIIDGYFQNIIREVGPSVTEVELLKDGGYRTIKEEVFNLSDEDDDMPTNVQNSPSGDKSGSGKPNNSNGGPPNKKPVCDDIIVLDSDDDDDVQKAVEESHKTAALESSKANGSMTPLNLSSTPTTKTNTPSSDDSIIILDDDTPPRSRGPGPQSRVEDVVSTSGSFLPTHGTAVANVSSCAGAQIPSPSHTATHSNSNSAFQFHSTQIPPPPLSGPYMSPWSNSVTSSAQMIPNHYMNFRNGGQPNMIGRNIMQTMPQQFAYHQMMQPPQGHMPMNPTRHAPPMAIPSTTGISLAAMPPRSSVADSNGQVTSSTHLNGTSDGMNGRAGQGAVNLSQVLQTLNNANANQYSNPYSNNQNRS